MTQFEKTYLMHKKPLIAVSNSNEQIGSTENIMHSLLNTREEFAMQLQYRELDRLSMELEKELQAVKILRAELEKFKMDFSVSVTDEATKKIQEVVSGINRMFK